MTLRRVVLFLVLVALAGLIPTAWAQDPVQDVQCQVDPAACPPSDDEAASPVEDVEAAAPVAVPQPPGADLLAKVEEILKDAAGAVSGAAGEAAGMAGAAMAAVGAAFMALMRSYAELWLLYKPANMPIDAYAGIAAGSTGVAAMGAQGSLYYAWRKLLPFLAMVPGFSRIAKDELLEHERRARIHDAIRQNPGVRLGELSRLLDIPWGSCMHHLRKLRADRIIMFKQVGHHKCFFINGSGLSENEMQAASVLKGDTLQSVAAWIEQHPGTSLKDLALGLGISPPLAAFHVGKLETAGLVQKTRDGRSVQLHVATRLPPGSLTMPPPALSMPVAPIAPAF